MIPVEPYYLHSIRQQAAYTWRKILCELIDNSFDAEARTVTLQFKPGKVFSIQDDGTGTDDLMRMVTLGKRHEHTSNDVGKYGVGCKHALIWLWGKSRIVSTREGVTRCLEMNWPDIASGDIPYPACAEVVEQASKPGTLIECFSERTEPKFQDLIPSLSATYSPGMELGKRIVLYRSGRIAGTLLQPVRWPATTEEIDDTIEAAGRIIRVRMGIVAEGQPNPYEKGFSFERKYRVIKQSLLGANGFATSRLAARITLGKDWELSTNKDDFFEFQDELADAIYSRCHDLMKQASEQAITIEESSFNQELAALVVESTRRKERRDPPAQSTGAVEPKNTGRQRRNAEKSTDDPGSVVDTSEGTRRKRRGFQIDTYHDSDGSFGFGFYDESANRLRLNISNPWLADKHRSRNMDALLPVIYGILANHEREREAESTPLFTDQSEDFVSLWGRLVSNSSAGEVTL